MKKLFLAVSLIYLCAFNIVIAKSDIVFIDMDKVVTLSKPGASILRQLNDINKKNITNLKEEEKNLKEKETKLIAQKNILSEVEFQTSTNKLRLEINNYNQNKKKIISNFTKLKVSSTNKLLELITPILTKYSQEKSISLILQKKNLIIGKTELDISDEIIKIVNKDIKEFKIK